MDPNHAKQESGPDLDPPDRELIDRVRAGDLEAFDPLYRRHRSSALRHARYWTRSEAASEDLSAEAFTRVLYAIRNGNGPAEAFRPYLLTAMRNVARDWAEGDRRTVLVPDFVDVAPVSEDQDPVIAALERSLAGLAFSSLPERWQTVLWQTEVEREGPTQIAPQLGIDAAAVAALAYRAREGLKQAYLQAHITEIGSPACRPFAERLGTHTRGKLRGREAAKVRHHLKHCADCVGLYAMLKYVNGNLRVLIAPAVLGAAAAARAAILAGAGAAGAAGGSAVSGGAHQGLVTNLVSKARHASPRQQALAAGTTVAAVAAAVAYALSGNPPAPPPVAQVKPKPVVAPSTPAPPPPGPSPSPPPAPSSAPPPVPVTVAPGTPAPPPPPKPAPTKPAPPPRSAPPPSPSPSPTKPVNCPNTAAGVDVQVDLGGVRVALEIGLDLALGAGTRDTADPGAAAAGFEPATCSTQGPPRPFPLATTPSAAGSPTGGPTGALAGGSVDEPTGGPADPTPTNPAGSGPDGASAPGPDPADLSVR